MAIRTDLALVPDKIVLKQRPMGVVMKTLCHEQATPANLWTLVQDASSGRLVDMTQGDTTNS
ncbi:hypothetical protein RMN56_17805 [Micromonospora halotolerans]|uniref:Uncharacterized protein n=1 Tax=Micromonospora halotolerans TaxID=709879 RepID=A0ABY9ZQ88_9ACTN|nr:hypothetical protein [Micromonospora halotolerans]WNM37047.1 hypothetical protein RMN56_17805 [Micromonospora halotolerans]